LDEDNSPTHDFHKANKDPTSGNIFDILEVMKVDGDAHFSSKINQSENKVRMEDFGFVDDD
jgi:hypothetical protein